MQYKSPQKTSPKLRRSSQLRHNRSQRTDRRVVTSYMHHAGADESHMALVRELFFSVYRNMNEFRAIVGFESLAGILQLTNANQEEVVRTIRRLRSVVHSDQLKRKLEANGGFNVTHVEVMFFAEVLTNLYTDINTLVQSLLERKMSLHRFRLELKNYFPEGPDQMSVSAKIREWCIETRSGKLSNPTSDYEQTVAACMDAYVRDHPVRGELTRQEQEQIARLERERIAQEQIARLERERIAQERIARLERELIAQERISQERIAQERIAQERIAQERIAQEQIARLERERIAQEQIARLERERIAQQPLNPGHVAKHETRANATLERCACRKLTKSVCKNKPGCKWTIGIGCRVDSSRNHI